MGSDSSDYESGSSSDTNDDSEVSDSLFDVANDDIDTATEVGYSHSLLPTLGSGRFVGPYVLRPLRPCTTPQPFRTFSLC